jgi:hypothetical protein
MSDATKVECFSGLDLGQGQEFSAFAVLERTTHAEKDHSGRPVRSFAVRHLERFPLGMPYPEIGRLLSGMFATPPLAGSTLVVDITMVAKPVLALLRRSQINARIQAVAVTAGLQATWASGVRMVPKRELVGQLQDLLKTRRLHVASSLKDASTLVEELLKFKPKPPPLKGDMLDWRDRPHDDLVFAVAIAAWEAEHRLEFWIQC